METMDENTFFNMNNQQLGSTQNSIIYSYLPTHPWANMTGRRNKDAFEMVLNLIIA